MTKMDRAENAYNEAKTAAEIKYNEATAKAWSARTGAERRAAIQAADDQIAADYQTAQDLWHKVMAEPEPHWGETEWAQQNVGLN